ncbi:MAG: DUF554 domain-containing protein [Chloroflexi bacterium HGW-Chloroflexi-8]|nr:MAG: DUF554 domain-containing protein [Chloroflexi bacterium HGW-Chloroflexi-8]
MTGTILNFFAIITGGLIGLLLGNRFSEKIRLTIMNALGLFTMLYGIRLFTQTNNAMVVLVSLILGILLGEWLKIEEALGLLAIWFEKKFNKNNNEDSNRFIKGFLTTSLLYCIGPMAILGSIQDGLTGDFNTLAIKAVIDGISAIAFASSLGVGVLFSSVIVILYQGIITLLAAQIQFLMSDVMLSEVNALGGIMLVGLAVSSLLEIRKIRVANFLPGFLIVPFIVLLFKYLGIY